MYIFAFLALFAVALVYVLIIHRGKQKELLDFSERLTRSGAMTGTNQKALYIAEQCRKAGMTLSGAAGILANIEAESVFKSTNLQDTYEVSLRMNDAQYTAAVDSGSYTRFTVDEAGYGLCQWTAKDRKAGMISFHRQRGVSIGDFRTQVDWMLLEIRGYGTAWRVCTSSLDPYECGYSVCKYYEIPANTEAQAQYRGGQSQRWYDFLVANINTEISIPEEETTQPPADEELVLIQDDGTGIPKIWPPAECKKGDIGNNVMLLQALLNCRGYGCRIDGIFGGETDKQLRRFMENCKKLADTDGVCTPLVWEALLSLGVY